ncbi:MAG: hypothetical protein AABY06_00230 [Nanoarchaeota archaeon]
MENKRAWTSVIEVFVSILLIAGIMAVVVNSDAVQKPKIGEQIYKDQALTLKIIQLDDSLRQDVLNDYLSQEINNTINNTMPKDLECEAKICILNDECNLDALPEKEIYAKSVLITATADEYKPKELKLWCWEK